MCRCPCRKWGASEEEKEGCNGGFIHAEPARSHHPSSSHRHSPLFAHGGLLSSLFLSLRIPFFYHLASPLPVEASCIQRSKSCSVSKSEERLHKITNSIHSLKKPRHGAFPRSSPNIPSAVLLVSSIFHFILKAVDVFLRGQCSEPPSPTPPSFSSRACAAFLSGIPAAVLMSESECKLLSGVRKTRPNQQRNRISSPLTLSLSLSVCKHGVSGIFAHCTEELGCRVVLGIGHSVQGCAVDYLR